jgi:hypothetical protein
MTKNVISFILRKGYHTPAMNEDIDFRLREVHPGSFSPSAAKEL